MVDNKTLTGYDNIIFFNLNNFFISVNQFPSIGVYITRFGLLTMVYV
jgi:hypothetical protein